MVSHPKLGSDPPIRSDWESGCDIPRRISSNSETVGISRFLRHVECGTLGTL